MNELEKKISIKFLILEWLGTLSILLAYFFTSNNTNIDKNIIGVLNLYGGTILSTSCYLKKNWSVFVVEFIWAMIAIYHLVKLNLLDN